MIQSTPYVHNPAQRFEEPDDYPPKADCSKRSRPACPNDRQHQVPSAKPAGKTIRYDFVREGDRWKIDEIKGAIDGEAGSLRAIITHFLKH
jgi:hypothetical protein